MINTIGYIAITLMALNTGMALQSKEYHGFLGWLCALTYAILYYNV